MLNSLSINPVLGFAVQLEQIGPLVLSTLVFTILGILLFALAFFVIVKAAPFSVRKELEEDHNTALAIVIGSVIIGIAMVISAAIHG
jgi:putative membrane protein